MATGKVEVGQSSRWLKERKKIRKDKTIKDGTTK